MNKQTTIIVSSVVVACLVFVGLGVALFNAGTGLQTSTTVKTETPTEAPVEAVEPKGDTQVTLKSDDLEDEIPNTRENFMSGCTEDGTVSNADCMCMYDYVNDNLTNAEFKEVIKEALDGKTPDVVYDAATYCS